MFDLLLPDSFELVPNDDISDKEDRLDVDQLPEFMWIVFSMTSEDLSCINAIEKSTLMLGSFNTYFLADLYFCMSLYIERCA